MNPVTLVTGTAYPWGAKNVDTDVIIPARWLKTITRAGLGRGAFETVAGLDSRLRGNDDGGWWWRYFDARGTGRATLAE